MRIRSRMMVLVALMMLSAVAPALAADGKKGFVGMQIKAQGADPVEVVIDSIVPNSPAEKAGLQVGDVIVKVANVEAKDVPVVIKTISGFSPGDKINVEIRRDGKEQTIKVTLGERPGDID